MTTEQERIATFIEGPILRISIQRPDKLNALTLSMYDALSDALLEAEQNSAIRVIVLHGTYRCFTSGNDLHDFAQNPPQGENSPVFRFLKTVSRLKKPLIAMVSGSAVGIGTTLLLHCDLVYADETARFQLPFVSLGLCPEAASSLLLPQLVGRLKASELLLLGETINAAEAQQLGLVNALFATTDLASEVMKKAARLAAQPPEAVRITKELLKTEQSHQVQEVMSREGKLFLDLLSGPEAQAIIRSFIEKS